MVSRSRIFTLRGLTLFVFFLLAVLASAQEDVPAPEDPEAIADEHEHEEHEEDEEGDSAEEAEEELADDQHDECAGWAYDGECEENSDMMWEECMYSCDNHEKCEAWAGAGNCESNHELMMETCEWYCDEEEEEL
jgi:hypothetical protein